MPMDGADLSTPSAPAGMMHEPQGVGQQPSSSSRPSLGFPLGTALLLLVIFCLSGIFSCCYHWEKLRSLRNRRRTSSSHSLPLSLEQSGGNTSHRLSTIPSPPSKLATTHQDKEQSLPVIMPGDQIPKYMAWPCPCQPALPTMEKSQRSVPAMDMEKIIVEVVLAAPLPPPPPFPPLHAN